MSAKRTFQIDMAKLDAWVNTTHCGNRCKCDACMDLHVFVSERSGRNHLSRALVACVPDEKKPFLRALIRRATVQRNVSHFRLRQAMGAPHIVCHVYGP